MRLIHFNKVTKVWLISALAVLFVNLVVFIFQRHFDRTTVLFIVLLTPVVWVISYFLLKLFFGQRSDGLNLQPPE